MIRLKNQYKASIVEYLLPPLSHRDKSGLYRRISTALNAGLNYKKLSSSMRPRTPGQKKFYSYLRQAIKEDLSLSSIFSAYPIIAKWQTEWIQLAERSGKYSKVFSDLSVEEDHLAKQKGRLESSLTRPMMTFIAACFLAHLDKLILGKVSLGSYLFYSLRTPMIAVMVFLLVRYLIKAENISSPLESFLEKLAMRIPKLKTYLAEIYTYRFSSSLLYAVEAGVPINQGLEIASRCTGSEQAMQAWNSIRMHLRQAYELPSLLSQYGFLSFSSINYVTVGLKSGRLDTALLNIREESSEKSQAALVQLCRIVSLVFEIFVIYQVATTFIGTGF